MPSFDFSKPINSETDPEVTITKISHFPDSFEPSTNEQPAVECRELVFSYHQDIILNKATISIKKGEIFALLGPSGCGKTTLLRCVLGRIKPRFGQVKVFCEEPDTPTSDVPGPGVGYMPQELGLIDEFTIGETVNYFGKLFSMSPTVVGQRINFLVNLLELPDQNQRISQLSGGQQRRVSLLAAFVHQPTLLVLDEPTVGLDSLLRDTIWNYLKSLSKDHQTTILITTHYTEEARSADVVGLMRTGRILAQEHPDCLIQRLDAFNLEDVFLKVCENDEINIQSCLLCPLQDQSLHPIRRRINMIIDHFQSNSNFHKKLSANRIRALIYKNLIDYLKNRGSLFMFIFLPAILMLLISSSQFGKKPRNLPITVFNEENPKQLSEDYLKSLDHERLLTRTCDSLDEAVDAVRKGRSWAALNFHPNFSSAFKLRAADPGEATEEVIDDSTIRVYIDNSFSSLGLIIHWALVEAYQKFLAKYLTEYQYDYNPEVVNVPIKQYFVYGVWEESLEGLDSLVFTGISVLIIYGIPLTMAAYMLVHEREAGLLDRSFVAGVQPTEVIVSHLVILLSMLAIQVALLMVSVFIVFETPLIGSVINAFGLLYMQGFQGIAFGMLLSSLSKSMVASMILSYGIVLPLFLISGIMWPIEAMPWLIRELVKFLPLTLPVDAFRSVVFRGWPLLSWGVAVGYLVSFAFITLFVGLSLFVFHFNITYQQLIAWLTWQVDDKPAKDGRTSSLRPGLV